MTRRICSNQVNKIPKLLAISILFNPVCCATHRAKKGTQVLVQCAGQSVLLASEMMARFALSLLGILTLQKAWKVANLDTTWLICLIPPTADTSARHIWLTSASRAQKTHTAEGGVSRSDAKSMKKAVSDFATNLVRLDLKAVVLFVGEAALSMLRTCVVLEPEPCALNMRMNVPWRLLRWSWTFLCWSQKQSNL